MKNLIAFLGKAALCSALLTSAAQATTVLFKTSMGDFEVELLDEHTPKTVENFLAYVENGSYNNVLFHRSIKGFIAQSGGFSYDFDEHEVSEITSLPTVINEPVFSNVRGTIAMAKVGGEPNSATSEWFFNVGANASNLDFQNGGFTVFGVVTEPGMEIIDAINDLPIYNLGSSAFSETPIQHEPAEGEELTGDHLVVVESITVINSEPNTIDELPLPSRNTGEKDDGDDDSSSGGGSSSWLLALAGLALTARRNK
ncbi:peptidylprolyl isomerase [Thalassotalea sp. Y01]|uniref:peptidylprolyl isomerase n=1 Tax=Thalassotalea sp. Y01 TaxID=2729613 RepID=UPI00145F3E47|nr:peptidylprolyl isomerase [Thalassotalea sp. Y01]NMP16935.1 peptidylprolyl isomerase [Thalassotalea sp. Y01]